MIWAHETTIDIDGTDVRFGWDVIGEDYEGSFYEPPSFLEIEWEQLDCGHIELDDDNIKYVNDVLWDEFESLKRDAMERMAEARAFDPAYG